MSDFAVLFFVTIWMVLCMGEPDVLDKLPPLLDAYIADCRTVTP